ncbi:hypothetical protein Tco_0672270 [Tanacetum coccineum]
MILRDIQLFSSSLELAMDEAITRATEWMNTNLIAKGGTTLLLPLKQAFDMLGKTGESILLIFSLLTELVNGLCLWTPENKDKQKLKDVRMPKDGDDGFFLITETRNHQLQPEISCSCSGVCDENDPT